MELKSLKKKYKSKGFAAGCSREVIEQGAEMLGWPLDEVLQKTLDAKSVSVDSCWVNFFDPDKMAEAFQLPKNEEILTCLALGYPAEGAGPLANHNSRKPIEETVTYL